MTFGIEQVYEWPAFEEWLAASAPLTSLQRETLERLQKRLLRQAEAWNEDELKLFFIGPLLELADLETEYFRPFTQRTLRAKIGDIDIGGKVDFMLAQGRQTPRTPFFCLHEYKQENRRDNDPRGQVLIGMVAAQARNEASFPIYGIYISGRNWFFILLQDKKYIVSRAYPADGDDIFKVFPILQKSKELMYEHARQAALAK